MQTSDLRLQAKSPEPKARSPKPGANRSEVQLQSQLQLTRIVRRGNRPESGGAPVRVRRTEVRAIEEIERFEAELHVAGGRHRKVFAHRKIHLPEQRLPGDVARGVAKRLADV